MPTFLDMTGFDNEETEINKEMLSILFNGKLKNFVDNTIIFVLLRRAPSIGLL
jgi:hypothetical protein